MMRSYRVDTAAGWWPDCGFRRLSDSSPKKPDVLNDLWVGE
jgi:hypothetical protein